MRCGGQGVYLWFLARELTRLGHTVDVFVGPPYPDPMPFARTLTELPNEQFWARWFGGSAAAMLPDSQLSIFQPLNFYELAATRFGFLPEPFAFSLRALRAMATELRRGARYDVIHDVQCLGWGVLAMRALGMPVVTTIHHPLTVDRRASFIRDEGFRDALGTMTFYPVGMQASVARRIESVFTSSAVSARAIVRDFRVSPERIRMVANGVDTDLFCPDPSVPKVEGEILCVGRASDPNKGVKTLVDALHLLPESVVLTLVDDDHPENGARVRARELGIADRLNLVGRVSTEELIHLYRRASLVAVPSRYEGFGLPAAEAMACGTPVVSTSAGALPEVVGDAGLLVPRDDPAALASGIASLLDRAATRRELGPRGRRRIEESYSWRRVAMATSDAYAEVVNEWRGRPANTMTSARAGKRRAHQSSASSVC